MIPIAPQDDRRTPTPQSGAVGSEISMTRIYLPFAMVITLGMFLVVAGYTVGSVMSGIARDKTETEKRLSLIEKELTAIKNILSERKETPQKCLDHPI
jgi:hypothetical protein